MNKTVKVRHIAAALVVVLAIVGSLACNKEAPPPPEDNRPSSAPTVVASSERGDDQPSSVPTITTLDKPEEDQLSSTSSVIAPVKSKSDQPSNALMVIAPYKYAGTWVFDDPAAGLEREPFVSGIPEIIDEGVKDIPGAEEGFRMLFSTEPFPGHTHKLVWRRGDGSGNWYYCEQYDKEGWLCPALFKYFSEAPKEIYVKAEPR